MKVKSKLFKPAMLLCLLMMTLWMAEANICKLPPILIKVEIGPPDEYYDKIESNCKSKWRVLRIVSP